jgi:uncharacterized Fe-S cluster protein YjdI
MSQKPPADTEEQELAISNARAYTAPGLTVFHDRGRCVHFAECVRGLSQVFDVEKRPWIQPQNASADLGRRSSPKFRLGMRNIGALSG